MDLTLQDLSTSEDALNIAPPPVPPKNPAINPPKPAEQATPAAPKITVIKQTPADTIPTPTSPLPPPSTETLHQKSAVLLTTPKDPIIIITGPQQPIRIQKVHPEGTSSPVKKARKISKVAAFLILGGVALAAVVGIAVGVSMVLKGQAAASQAAAGVAGGVGAGSGTVPATSPTTIYVNSYTFIAWGGPYGFDGVIASATFLKMPVMMTDGSGILFFVEGQYMFPPNTIRYVTATNVKTIVVTPTIADSIAQGAFDSAGNLYLTTNTHKILKLVINRAADPYTATATVFAGSGTAAEVDGTGTAASLKKPWGIAIDSSDVMYVTTQGNALVRKVTIPGAVVTTLAGSTAGNDVDGTGTAASFRGVSYVAVDNLGSLYVVSSYCIRQVNTATAYVSTIAGDCYMSGSMAPGPATGTKFSGVIGQILWKDNILYIIDQNHNRIHYLYISSGVCNLDNLAGDGTWGIAYGAALTGTEFKNINSIAIIGTTMYVGGFDATYQIKA